MDEMLMTGFNTEWPTFAELAEETKSMNDEAAEAHKLAAYNRAINALTIELLGRGEPPETIYATVMAEVERMAVEEARARIAATASPLARALMTMALEKEVSHADQP